MNKKQLVSTLSGKLDMSHRKTATVVDTILNTIIDSAKNDGRCMCGGHIFKLKKLASRTGRNPNTGEKITIPEKTVITYRKSV